MSKQHGAESASTGNPCLDRMLQGILYEDNVVWRIDSVDEYLPFARTLAAHVASIGGRLTYFRFARHEPVLDERSGAEIVRVSLADGFENFITRIHTTIEAAGKRTFYVFDSLSDLGQTWYSDRMIGNFFKLTCPYLYVMETVAYFALYRNHHSYHAVHPISATTQLLIDVYRSQGRTYLFPQKVDGRYSPTLFSLHRQDGDEFTPITSSHVISDVLGVSRWHGLRSASYRMVGIWDHTFLRAEETLRYLHAGLVPPELERDTFVQLAHLILSSEERILALAGKYMTLADLLRIWRRMIGTGMIGGKAVGMLLARAILAADVPDMAAKLECHDSFFIGSDVFYTYLVENDCWRERQRQKHPDRFLEGNEEVRERLLNGDFPDYIVSRFSDMLDYYGQSPIIVRSSSLLEDNFGNAFAGKYESVFCPNQGTLTERLDQFMAAVRLIYASTMNETALRYRMHRGVLDRDEQMALLVQRVSGDRRGPYFFPQLAGVAFSFNSYVWNRDIDPTAGVVRLVFGLGTRAVDRADDDYTRVVALNQPLMRPESNLDDVTRYSQRRLDAIDLDNRTLVSKEFAEIVPLCRDYEERLFVTRDRYSERRAREHGRRHVSVPMLAFDRLLKETSFVALMRRTLDALRSAYGCHVDIEFTANFSDEEHYSINLVQCRPLQVQTDAMVATEPMPSLQGAATLLHAGGGVIGHSRQIPITRVVYVVPELYGQLPEQDRYQIARLVGKICQLNRQANSGLMLIGPGRWGTSTPSLGVPVSFAEIAPASVLCEVNIMHSSLVPDLSLGTHFFNEMVENNILYLAYFSEKQKNRMDFNFLTESPNLLAQVLPDAADWAHLIHVIDGRDVHGRQELYLCADSIEQQAELLLARQCPLLPSS